MQAPLIVDGVRNCSSRDSVALFGLPLSRAKSLEHAFDLVRELFTAKPARAGLVTFANPLAVRIAAGDAGYRNNLGRMDFVFCDGIALAVAARRLGRFPMGRISFDSTSLAPKLFEFARRLAAEYPGISIIAALDGYRPQRELVGNVSLLTPQIVICGMGAPRQEEFLVALADAGWKGVGFTCGGYFDHLGQGFQFYPALLDRLNLRWLYRIAREPRRIGYRALIEYGPFWLALAQGLLGRGRPSGGPQRSV
jgi:N-acetylglucosaminyldiphosphoundecaprenol N-acetyl-beta-D-mannosaminyltransferase